MTLETSETQPIPHNHLILNVDEFVGQRDIEEGHVVKGKHMTFMANVFGRVESAGGDIRIKRNLSGGAAESQAGNVIVDHRASRAVVYACEGDFKSEFCDNSVIVAKRIQVKHAVNCELVAETVLVQQVEGCRVVGKQVRIGSSNEKRDQETLVTVLIPDLQELDLQLAELELPLSDIRNAFEAKAAQIKQLKADEDFAKFLLLHKQLKQGLVQLRPEQNEPWREMVARHSATYQQLSLLNNEALAIKNEHQMLLDQLRLLKQQRLTAGDGVCCEIRQVLGTTIFQTMLSSLGFRAFARRTSSEIRDTLQRHDEYKQRLFSASKGQLNWVFNQEGKTN